MQMSSSVGHLCSVCLAASIPHKEHILALKKRNHWDITAQMHTEPPRSNTAKIIKHWHTVRHTHNWEVEQDWRVVKAFISWLKEKDPPDIPEGTDQSRPDWFKLFVLDFTSITIRWSSVSDYSTAAKKKHFQLGHGEIDSHHLIYSARLITQGFLLLMQPELRLSLVLKEVIVLC